MDSLENLVLTLKPDNVSNTSLVSQHGDIVYTVVTEHTKKATTTYVRKGSEEPIASLEWRDVRPDRVSIGGNKPVSLGDWMKRSAIPFKDDISFVDDKGRKYKWKGNSAGRSFELYAADDNYTSTIARFQRSRRVLVKPTDHADIDPNASTPSLAPTLVNPGESNVVWAPATLTLAPRAQEIQDTVVAAFLFLEKSRRINETEVQSRGDVLGTPAIGAARARTLHNGGV